MASKYIHFQTISSRKAGQIQRTKRNVAFPHKVQVDKVLDCRLLNSPLPIIKLRCEMKQLEIGHRLELLVTDLESKKYIPIWCKRTGNDFLEISGKCGVSKFIIYRKK